MSLPSFSCNLTKCTQILVGVLRFFQPIRVYSGQLMGLGLSWRVWDRSGLWSMGLEVSHLQF